MGVDYAFVNRMDSRDTDVAIYLLEERGVKPSEAARLILNGLDELDCRGTPPEERLRVLGKCLREGIRLHRESDKSISFAEAVQRTLDGKAGQSPRTVQDFRQCMNRLMESVDGLRERPLNRIGTQHCTEILEAGFPSETRRRKARACLSVLFQTGIRHGWCKENPVKGTVAPRIREKTIVPLRPEEIERLLRVSRRAEHRACRPAVALMLYTGVRPQEVTRLTYGCIDTESAELTVPPRHSKTGGGRAIPLCPSLRAILEETGPCAPEQRICPPNWINRWKELRRDAGFTEWQQDVLRHTFASYFAKAYRDLPTLQLYMGHRDVSLLLTRYVNLQGISRDAALRFFGEDQRTRRVYRNARRGGGMVPLAG